MFVLKENGWCFFEARQNKWIETGLTAFDKFLAQAESKAGFADIDAPTGSLPAFSGSKILCVGRNYRKHAAELGNDVPDRPLWFSKPPSSLIGDGGTVMLPSGVGRIDYEGEMVLVIGRKCSKIPVEQALSFIGGVAAGFDMTARDLQKSDGQWTRAKGFDTFLPLSGLVAPFSEKWQSAVLEVRLNDERVQYSSLDAMVFKFAELVSDISHCMTLEPGDLIMTGTPEGIGPVKSGDRLEMSISGPVRLGLRVNCR
ncbi:MAG: fumarylacetoacetate hydrolase family protein [Candidatus Rifleibacteriota bacterium]